MSRYLTKIIQNLYNEDVKVINERTFENLLKKHLKYYGCENDLRYSKLILKRSFELSDEEINNRLEGIECDCKVFKNLT